MHRQSRLILLLALGASFVVLAACASAQTNPSCGGGLPLESPACTHGPTGAPGGLSEAAAVAAARMVAPVSSPAPTLVWAAVEEDPFSAPATGPRRLVWEVRLQGMVGVSPCPSGLFERQPTVTDGACLDADSGLIVVLDYFTGSFVGWLH